MFSGFVVTMIAIMYFGLRRIRPRKVDFSQRVGTAFEPIELDCTFLFAEADLSHRRARLWVPIGAFLFGAFIVFVIGLGHEVETTTHTAIGFAVGLAFYALAWALDFIQMEPLRNALAAAKGVPLTFCIDEMGIQAPVLMVTEPLYWRASQKGMSHIVIPGLTSNASRFIPEWVKPDHRWCSCCKVRVRNLDKPPAEYPYRWRALVLGVSRLRKSKSRSLPTLKNT